jgi:hypothetical protein
MDMTFGTWSLSRAGSLETVASKLAKYNFDLVAVQEVRWVEGGSKPANDTYFSMEMRMLIIT